MILGMSTAAFTLLHVILSLIGIATGFVVLFGFFSGRVLKPWNAIFLLTTILTSASGFAFPFTHLSPGHILGILSLLVLAPAVLALYGRHLAGPWQRTYVIAAAIALYFNTFVLVVQLFGKVPALKALAPTQSEPPFAIAQLLLLVLFVVLTVLAAKKMRPQIA
ncbi:MAG TPA: hypothetical protein VGC07_10840 [Granulicella sp.]